jgi:hypothetical protein
METDNFEHLLTGEVQKYLHLYNSIHALYKDQHVKTNSWRDIVVTLGLDPTTLLKKWVMI